MAHLPLRAHSSTNDPSAGSPTETLLRLLLPLSNKVYKPYAREAQMQEHRKHPDYLPDYSIGRSDGRCVQRAGTQSGRDNDSYLLGIPR